MSKNMTDNNSIKLLAIARMTKNEKYLPSHLQVLMRCIEKGINNTRDIMELNPLQYKDSSEKNMMGTYGRNLRKLCEMGFLDRHLNRNLYIYTKKKLIPMIISVPANCYLEI